MKKKMKKSRLSLCLVLMLLVVMLLPTTSMAADPTRQEFDDFGPGDGEYVLHVKVSATDGVDDGYVDFGFFGPNDYKTYGNESKYIFNKEDTTSYYTLSLVPEPGKKLTYYKVVYDTGSTFEYGTSTGSAISYENDGSVEITITEPMTSQVDNNKVYIEATFEDAQAPGEPTNIRWEGKTVKWDAPASGADRYIIRTGYGTYYDGEWKTLFFVSQEMTVTQLENDMSGSTILDDNTKCLAVLYIISVKNGVRSEMVHSEPYAPHSVPNGYTYNENYPGYHWKECVNCGIHLGNEEEHDFGDDSVCDICGFVGTTYKFLEGMDGSWTQKSDKTLKFKADGEFRKFSKVKIDGVEISSDKYTASEGSTIIELKKDYLGTLSVGEHSITIVYKDGACASKFKVLKATEPTTEAPTTTASTTEAPTTTAPTTEAPTTAATTESEVDANPETGDGANISLMFALLFLSGTGMMIYFSKDKKAKR